MEFETIDDHELAAPVHDVAREAVDAAATVWARSSVTDVEESLRAELRSRGLRVVDDSNLRALADDIRAGRPVRLGRHDGSVSGSVRGPVDDPGSEPGGSSTTGSTA
jgi:uncharacterized protein (DUF1499 family)